MDVPLSSSKIADGSLNVSSLILVSTPSRLSLDRGGPRAIVKTFSRLLHVRYVNASPGSVLEVEGSALPGPSLSFFRRALLPRFAQQGRMSGIIRELVQHIILAYMISLFSILSIYLDTNQIN